MTHYDVLGVARDASTAEIRRQYLARARRVHPDTHAEADPATRLANEAEMRRLNEAWSTLGDPARRQRYDLAQRADRAAGPTAGPGSSRERDFEFVPYVDDDTDYAALLDDTPVGNGARLPRGAQLAPAGLLALALFSLSAGLVTSIGPLLAFGVICLVLSGASFALLPVLAIMRSLQSDRE